jgi:hypothetical protein
VTLIPRIFCVVESFTRLVDKATGRFSDQSME